MMDRGNLRISILKKWQIPKLSSWEVTAEFVNQVNNQVRKRQRKMSSVAGAGEEHSIIWGIFFWL